MPEWIVNYWVQWLFGILAAAISVLAATVRGRYKEAQGQDKAIKRGLNALLYINLKNAAHEHCANGWVSIHDMEDVEELYNTYHELGGNGTGTKLFEDIKKLPNRRGNNGEEKNGKHNRIY